MIYSSDYCETGLQKRRVCSRLQYLCRGLETLVTCKRECQFMQEHTLNELVMSQDRAKSVQRVNVPKASRHGVPHTVHGAMVHDAFPSFPPAKKKEKDRAKLLRNRTFVTILMRQQDPRWQCSESADVVAVQQTAPRVGNSPRNCGMPQRTLYPVVMNERI